MSRIDNCLIEYKAWCKKLGIETISDINKIISSGKINRLINISEIWHEQKLSEIAKQIQKNCSEKKIILISGPSSSGKTTFANRLNLHLKVLGINSVPISLDDYYMSFEDMPKNEHGKPDFEALESIDYKQFNKDVETLISGKEANLPTYNFQKRITTYSPLKLDRDEVIIVEGIHGLNPEITKNIPSENKYKIYCSALTALSYDDGTRIKSRTNRLIRRLIRDFHFRNSDYKFTLGIWEEVEKGAEKNIFPYTDTADIIFNSSSLYELAVYRNYLGNVLPSDINENDEYYDVIKNLTGLTGLFLPVNESSVPDLSIVREFIGESKL